MKLNQKGKINVILDTAQKNITKLSFKPEYLVHQNMSTY